MITGLDISFPEDVIEFAGENVKRVLRSGRLVYEEFCPRFEEQLCKRSGKKVARLFASDTSAQACLYRALGFGPGDVIVFQGNAFPTPTFEAERAGMTVAWVDIDPDTLDIDTAHLQWLFRSLNVKALSVMSTGGRLPSNLTQILGICEKYGVTTIDDAAHSFGSKRTDFEGFEYVGGGWADFGVYSFYATKAMTTGEGGAIVTDFAEIADRAAQYARYGKETFFGPTKCEVPGFSCRFTELLAAVGVALYNNVDAVIEARDRIAQRYLTELKDDVHFFDYGQSNWYKIPCMPKHPWGGRDLFRQHLKERGIGLSAGVYDNVAFTQPGFGGRFDRLILPGVQMFCGNHFCLPLHEGLTDDDVTKVIETVKEFFGGYYD